MAANQQQIDNLVALLDGYVQKGGHHLNVNVFTNKRQSRVYRALYPHTEA